jgi:hypothetical protein
LRLDGCAAALDPLELLMSTAFRLPSPSWVGDASFCDPIAGNTDPGLTRMPAINMLHLCDLALSIFFTPATIVLIAA